MLKIACCQMTSGGNLTENLATARSLVRKAALNGAEIAVLPELFAIATDSPKELLKVAEAPENGPIQDSVKSWAREFGIAIAGSFPIRSDKKNLIFNSCMVFDQFGGLLGRYDKIHLFSYSNEHENYDEAKLYAAGSELSTFLFPLANGLDVRIGLAICFDLRFPELFRKLDNPDLVLMPSAFTATTGRAHWEILVRARAIENLCYVAASDMAGLNDKGRRCWGHSMIVGPWGNVLSELGEDDTGVCFGNLDLNLIKQVRTSLPCLQMKKLI